MEIVIPKSVLEVMGKLEAEGFEAFVVGGCVRDLLLGKEPKDWDVATNAKPEKVLKIFPDSVYENEFGTVGVKVRKQDSGGRKLAEENDENNKAEIVEVTTYRIESKYSDKRHPDQVRFAKTLEEDLSRRDFTVNALALKVKSQKSNFKITTKKSKISRAEDDFEIIDLFDGRKDLANKLIRAVGNADERFDEDALRMMRAVRFAVSLQTKNQNSKLKTQNHNLKIKTDQEHGDWKIEKETFKAIKKNADNLKYISKERIRDELEKIILSSQPARGVGLLVETGLISHIMPELLDAVGVRQNRHHYHGPYNTVYKHMLASLEKCPSKKLEVRLASFLHDIGKPRTKQGEGEMATFHNHEYAGAKMVREILERLKFSRKVIDKTVLLVKNHMFYYNVDEVGESGVRRVIRKVGLENINDLIDVRIADRLGSGVPKAVPYKLRHFKYMVEKVSKDAISVGQLKIDGNDLMDELGLKPGPKIGAILDVLLSRVIDEPELNNKKDLLKIAKEFEKKDLKSLRGLAKEKIEAEREKENQETKKKHWVK